MDSHFKFLKASFWKPENLILIIYLVLVFYPLINNKFNFINWLFLTILFIFLYLGIKIYRTIHWIFTHIIEEVFYEILYKMGLGKLVLKMIRSLDAEKKDLDYQKYRQYMDRKKVFARILRQQWFCITKDIGEDTLFLLHHYLYQKKKIITQKENDNRKNFNDLSIIEFENLLLKLFQSMGYSVSIVDNTDKQIAILIMNLKNQKILIFASLKNILVQSADINQSLQEEKNHNCKGTIFISLSNFGSDTEELINTNHIGLINRDRLGELIHQYLHETWS